MVRELEAQRGGIGHLGGDRLHRLLELGHAGRRRAVREDEAVADEGGVVRLFAEVAAVGVDFAPVLGLRADAVVDPLPDEGAAELRVLPNDIPVLLHAARAVAHGVDVLAEDEGALVVLLDGRLEVALPLGAVGALAGADALALGDGGVHAAVNVDDLALVVALVVKRTGRVELASGLGHLVVVAAEVRLVAERPEDDGRVVAVACDHADHAVDAGGLPLGVVGDVARGVAEAVRLEVALVDEVDAVFVAEVVPARVIGVVARADGVEVVALEEEDVLHHRVDGEGAPRLGVELVAVYAFEGDAAAVEEEDAVLDLDLAGADLEGSRHLDAPRGVAEGDGEVVEVGVLGVPEMRAGNLAGELDGPALSGDAHGHRLRPDGLAGGVRELGPDLAALEGGRGAGDGGADGERRVAVVGVKRGGETDVLDRSLREGDERDGAKDAAQPPHVLVFEIGACRPLDDADGEDVLAIEVELVRDVELVREAAAHPLPHALAI